MIYLNEERHNNILVKSTETANVFIIGCSNEGIFVSFMLVHLCIRQKLVFS